MPSSRQVISNFIRRGYIKPKQINEALICTEVSPNIDSWFKFINRLLLSLGALSLGFAILFFIAYNWSEFGRVAKFTLLESLLVAVIFIYWRSKQCAITAQVSLLVSCLLVGVLMAFLGQTYQTGADPWMLFFFWALLITPWVIIAHFAPLWLSWLGLLNIALSLYINSFGVPFSLLFSTKNELWIALFLLNSVALITLEISSQRFNYLSPRWIARTIASFAGSIITFTLIEHIISSMDTSNLPLLLWGIFIASLYVVYRHLRADLFMLAGGCLSSIVIIVTFFIQQFSHDFNEGLLLIISLLIIGLTSLATFWLKKVHKEIL